MGGADEGVSLRNDIDPAHSSFVLVFEEVTVSGRAATVPYRLEANRAVRRIVSTRKGIVVFANVLDEKKKR